MYEPSIPPSHGTPSRRPSKSERPGMPRFLAALMVDPTYFIFRLVVAVAEGVTKGLVVVFQKRREKRIAKRNERKK